MAVRKEDVVNEMSKAAATMAELADRHELYEESVQNVEEECAFVSDTFKEYRRRAALLFREDFCGTASAACQWTRLSPQHRAVGVDVDEEVLDWGRRNRVSRLNDDQKQRLELRQEDVRTVDAGKFDVVGAFNFSYFIFQKRSVLRDYFASVREALVDDGIFFLDAFGGYEAFEECKEKTKYDNFTYIWDQAHYYPVTGEMVCHIHFRFPDKSKLKNAFTYVWRLWTLPELQEILEEAGFGKVTVYWEGTDEDGEGNGEFTPDTKGEADAGWIVYIVAEK